jgi:hypothetical protein
MCTAVYADLKRDGAISIKNSINIRSYVVLYKQILCQVAAGGATWISFLCCHSKRTYV